MTLKPQDRVILVGVGGATCSGKTTVAKHLLSILPNSFIIHQDDFAPPDELAPIHPVHNVADWDSPQGAIEWPRLRAFLQRVKEIGTIPPDHKSHDHMVKQKDVPLTDSVLQELIARFEEVEDEQRKRGIRIIWGLVDGFLLYWDKEVLELLDIRFFLRVPHDVLKKRRYQREYPTAVQFNPGGLIWVDPPMYWENIVYPAYLEAHQDIFEDGDVENGKPTGQRVPDLVLIEPLKKGAELSIDEVLRRCCDVLCDFQARTSDVNCVG